MAKRKNKPKVSKHLLDKSFKRNTRHITTEKIKKAKTSNVKKLQNNTKDLLGISSDRISINSTTKNGRDACSEKLIESDQHIEDIDSCEDGSSSFYCCDTCNFKCKFFSRYQLHLRSHTGERPYSCSDCGKSFSTKHSLTCHERIHSGEKPYCCEVCGKSYRESTHLNTHMRIHTGLKPFICDRCSRGFARSSDLTRHIRIHSGEKPFKCSYCGKGFVQSNGLKYHLKAACSIKVQDEDALIQQQECHSPDDTRVINKNESENNSLNTRRSESHVCKICNKTFALKFYLNRHNKMHHKNIVYQCDVCNKKFTQSSTLAQHVATHTENKTHTCDHCCKVFFITKSHQKHMRTDSELQPYVCDICCKCSTQTDHQPAHHQCTHNEERPFNCHVCQIQFSQTSGLHSHKTHSKSYLCSLCSAVFNSLSDLLVHSAVHLINDSLDTPESKLTSVNTETS
ncbi:zinc finger protein 271-like [Gigantopelta aegis]|uniref:zinc finger protein 271-like n=1 Tax=Gigantopelta aegis TaxID=1735272 RepID=UPI001B88B20B|nr:zinc finger protein 271-like [Gigantopelta aegis]